MKDIIKKFGSRIGFAFQIVDDILDIESSDEVLGKNVGSDEENDKATYPKVCGIKKSKEIAFEMIEEAKNFLTTIKEDTFILEALAQFVINRVN